MHVRYELGVVVERDGFVAHYFAKAFEARIGRATSHIDPRKAPRQSDCFDSRSRGCVTDGVRQDFIRPIRMDEGLGQIIEHLASGELTRSMFLRLNSPAVGNKAKRRHPRE